MGDLPTNTIFATGLVCDLCTPLTQTDYLRARDQARLEDFSRELVENERLMQAYRITPPSPTPFFIATNRRHLQKSIVYALQLHQDHMAAEVHHLEEAIDPAEQLRDSPWNLESALSRELEYLERLISILD
ncbi:hypothetical protein LIER_30971 [Lithospermum erythrorhizon]|uniref:Uncharacterized protein n=1 Tax=Lithospermum erythrorhizon TaxID=34254 RepID=A0AAV3RPF3_LITER